MPARARIAATGIALCGRFLAEKASIDGGITQIRSAWRPSQANVARENT